MTSENVDTVVSFVGASAERMVRVERALDQLAKAIHLDLADIALGSGEIDEQTLETLRSLGQTIVGIAATSYDLLKDLQVVVGEEVEVPSQNETTLVPTTVVPPEGNKQPTRVTTSTTNQPKTRQARPQTEKQEAEELSNEVDKGTTETEAEHEARGNLYLRIVNPEELPKMKVLDEKKTVEVSIVGAQKLQVGERRFRLKGHSLFLFNAMLLLRDQPRSAAEIRELGFYPGATNGTAQSIFSSTMISLTELMNKAAGVELLKKVGAGRSTRYCVNPNLSLIDDRKDESEEPEDNDEAALAAKKN